jgi:glutamate carboxypeptidase
MATSMGNRERSESSADESLHGLAAALAAVRRRGDEMIAQTRAWVEINSFTANVAGVNAVGAQLREAFALPSLACTIVPGGPDHGDHLIWRTPAAAQRAPFDPTGEAPGPSGRVLNPPSSTAPIDPTGKDRTPVRPAAAQRAPIDPTGVRSTAPIVLIGHHDTVFPPGYFEGWREDGGRAIGPGTLDMKGGLAVIRAALAALDEVGALAGLPIAVVSVAEEEIGSPSSTPHLHQVARGAACALVFESGRAGDAIITRRKGVGAMTAVASGRAAHAGNAHKDGINAIWALAKFIDLAQQLTSYDRGFTVNVGLSRGGTSKNSVPDRAECKIDLRYETVADAEALVVALEAAAAAAAAAVPGARIELSRDASRLPLERSPASAALYQEYAACARAAGLGDGEAALIGGGSDANTVATLGVPAIDGLGPRGAGFHTTSEYVELASFVPKAEALVRFLWNRRATDADHPIPSGKS